MAAAIECEQALSALSGNLTIYFNISSASLVVIVSLSRTCPGFPALRLLLTSLQNSQLLGISHSRQQSLSLQLCVLPALVEVDAEVLSLVGAVVPPVVVVTPVVVCTTKLEVVEASEVSEELEAVDAVEAVEMSEDAVVLAVVVAVDTEEASTNAQFTQAQPLSQGRISQAQAGSHSRVPCNPQTTLHCSMRPQAELEQYCC